MIVVTGGSGFIGKHLLKALAAKYGTDNILAFTSKQSAEFNYLYHNDYNFDTDYFVSSGYADRIKTIIHVGAFTPKNRSQANNWEQCNHNVNSTGKLLSAVLPNLERFIYISTLDVYENDVIISENTQLLPASLYGDSKLYCEKMVTAWANANDICYQILRLGHVYGPGEELYEKIIPEIFKKILNNKIIEIWGTGEELRSFIYIDDVILAIMNAVNINESIGPVNIVSSQSISIIELVKKMMVICKADNKIAFIPTSSPSRSLVFDNSKLKRYLLIDETSLDIGLKQEFIYMNSK